MNLIKKFLLFISIIIPFFSGAQTAVSTVNDITWSLMPTWTNVSLFDVSASNYSGSKFNEGNATGIIKIDDNSIISNIQLDANNYAVIRLNKDLSTAWQTSIDGFPLAIGLFHGSILVISATEMSSWKGANNDYLGYLIDPKTGNVTLRKEIFNGDDQFYQQPVFLYAPDGSFFKLALRVSNFTRTAHNPLLMFKMNKVAQEYFDTNDFKLLEFDNALNVKSTIKPVLEQGYFIGATTNSRGDVFLMTEFSQGFIKIAKYESGKTTPAKVLQQPVSINDDIISNLKDFHLITSKDDPSILFFAGTYMDGDKDRELVVSKFNFNDGTVSGNVQLMNKDYFKTLEKSYVPFSKKFDRVDLGSKNEMKIKNVVENDGKLIAALTSYSVREGNAMAGTHTSIEAFDLLINIYDNKANLQYQQIIPRSYGSFFTSRLAIGLHCKDNMLYIIANNNKGIAGLRAIYSQVDLKTGAIANITPIDKHDIKSWYAVDPLAAFWFDDQFVLSYLQDKGWYNNSEDAHLQLLSY
jgi:hypothetical protein